MAGIAKWPGGPGKTYDLWVYPYEVDPPASFEGVYIFTKKVADMWQAVYIGQGSLSERLEAHRREGCVYRKGATHVHLATITSRDERVSMEKNLLAFNTEAYEPSGCNKRRGG